MDESDGNFNFAAELYARLTADQAVPEAQKNIIISPLLLESALALLFLGADGHTADELKRAARLKRFDSNLQMAKCYCTNIATFTAEENDTKIELCNRLLLNESYEVSEEFHKTAQKYFHTYTEKLDIKSVEKLRKSLKDSLSKLSVPEMSEITTKLPESNELDAILLIAANFRNKWFLPFSAYRSGVYDFQGNGGDGAAVVKSVPMLFDDDMFVKFAEFRELEARAIELPYEHDEELAMLLVLPNKRDGLAELTQQLKQQNLNDLTDRMQMESVQVLLPKFRIDYECSLRQCLEKLDVVSMFSKDANFKHLLRKDCIEPLRISDILHKVCIEVNESGTEASNIVANKPIVISNSIDSRQKKFFRADHPFFFAIRNQNATFFVGHVTTF